MNGATDAPSGAPSDRAGYAAIVGFCFCASLLEGFDIQAMGIAGPKMVPALGLAPGDAGLLFSASLFGMIPGALGGGWLADRLGHRLVLSTALMLFGVFTLLTAAAVAYPVLIGVRILAGLGLGAAMPSIIAVAAGGVLAARRAALVTSISAGLPFGAALAALVGRFTLAADWRILFWIGGVLPVLLGMAALRIVPRTRDTRAQYTNSGATTNPLGVGWRLVAGLLCASYLFTLMALLLLMNWLPLLLADSGIALGVAGLLVLGFNLGGTVGGVVLGRASAHWGSLRPLALVYTLLVVALIALGTTTFSLPVLAALLCCTGFLLMGGQCVLYGMGAETYPAAMRARGVGLAISAGRIGAMIGPALAGALIAAHLGIGSVLLVTAAIVAAAGAAALAVGTARRAVFYAEPVGSMP